MRKENLKPVHLFLWVGLYSIAMGFLESSVVVYLRAIYYPEGFAFPLKLPGSGIAVMEVIREAATVIMLLCIGIVAVRKNIVRFALFIYAFAIWDIFYYIFLYLLVQWPQSLLTDDLLFLIPAPWVGPVIAPVINSITMIILAVMIILFNSKLHKASPGSGEWTLLIVGSAITIIAYTSGYFQFMSVKFPVSDLLSMNPSSAVREYASGYIPDHFNWWLFTLAEVIFVAALTSFYIRHRRKHG